MWINGSLAVSVGNTAGHTTGRIGVQVAPRSPFARAGIRRIVAVASGVALPDAQRGGDRGEHGVPEVLKNVAAEHLRNHRTLQQAGDEWGLQWTLMCPLNLAEDIPAGHARRVYETLPEGSGETGMPDLALAMCDLVDDPSSFGQRVGIVSDRGARK